MPNGLTASPTAEPTAALPAAAVPGTDGAVLALAKPTLPRYGARATPTPAAAAPLRKRRRSVGAFDALSIMSCMSSFMSLSHVPFFVSRV